MDSTKKLFPKNIASQIKVTSYTAMQTAWKAVQEYDVHIANNIRKPLEWQITPLIHVRSNSYDIPTNLRTCFHQWSSFNPQFKVVLWTDFDVNQFLDFYYPHIKNSYQRVKDAQIKLDVFRSLVMYQYGGIFTALHTCPIKSIKNWFSSSFPNVNPKNDQETEAVRHFDLVLGREWENSLNFSKILDLKFSKAVIAAKAHHDFFSHLSQAYIKSLISLQSSGTWATQKDSNGRNVFNEGLQEYFEIHQTKLPSKEFVSDEGQFLSDSILFLPPVSFSAGTNPLGKSTFHPRALVMQVPNEVDNFGDVDE
jgi:mannosyltransferase OCH1-like enzyme